MKAPDWWWTPHPSAAARLLKPVGALYGARAAVRMARPGARAGVPVICVGNLVAGGAGKTPAALALARMLEAGGAHPAFLSRGYGRTRAGRRDTVIRVDPAKHSAAEVGDEPLLLAAVASTYVGVDRPAAARAARDAGADVLILDDGMQNPSLAKDFALAVVDGAVGVGNGLCLPAGPLRAPVDRQWPFVSAVCVVGGGAAGARLAAQATAASRPVFAATLVPDAVILEELRGARLLAFAGIGRPSKLEDTLRAAGLNLLALRSFPDHHRFSADDLATLQREAAAAGARLVTTVKDQVRLPPNFPARALPITLAFERPAEVAAAVKTILEKTTSSPILSLSKDGSGRAAGHSSTGSG